MIDTRDLIPINDLVGRFKDKMRPEIDGVLLIPHPGYIRRADYSTQIKSCAASPWFLNWIVLPFEDDNDILIQVSFWKEGY